MKTYPRGGELMIAIQYGLIAVNIISLLCVVLFFLIDLYGELNGRDRLKTMFKRMKIRLSYKQAVIIGRICLAINVISYFVYISVFE